MQTTATDGTPVDPTAAALTKAIRKQEGGDYSNYSGDAGTSAGAYQFNNGKVPLKQGEIPANFRSWAQEEGFNPNDFSPINQDKVVYHRIKRKLDEGQTQSSIAAEWNSGLKNGWENHVGTTTINGKAIHYDTPGYVNNVKKYYLEELGAQPLAAYAPPQIGGNTPPAPQGNSPYAPPAPPPPAAPLTEHTPSGADSFVDSAAGHVTGALGGISSVVSRSTTGEINPLSGILQGGGAAASGITGLANDVATHLPIVGGIVKGAEDLAGKGVQAAVNTAPGQKVAGALQKFSTEHPELSADIGGAVDIASVIPVFKGAGLIKDAAGMGLKGALTGTTDAMYEAVAPKLGAKALAKEISEQGTSQKGLLKKTVLNENPATAKIAETVTKEVPDFNPKAPIVEQIGKIQSVIDRKVEELKNAVVASGQDRIYSPNELRGVLGKIETPISLRGTAFEKQIKPLKEAVIKMAKEKGYKVSDLLSIRKEFDELVSRTWPNLYSSESAPMRQAVRGIRDALTSFTEDRLPAGFGLKEALTTQSRLIRAVENMAEKAASGATKEIGTTAAGRLLQRHPVARGLLKTATQGAGIAAGLHGMENLIP